MAQVKYGAIITEIKGKVGGTVFQGGRASPIMKNKSIIQYPRGGEVNKTRQTSQSNFGQVTKGWSKLTDGERASWSSLLGVWTFVNKFGETYDGSAYQIYTAANINRMLLELSPLTSAPVADSAVDPIFTWANYSISGTFVGSYTNNLADFQYAFMSLSQYANATTPPNKIRKISNGALELKSPRSYDFKSAVQAIYGGNPPLGSFFYIETWFCKPDYPKAQFKQIFKIEVVA
ncbi:MAG: hypothetical protein IT237_04375 [Bacteroidia bacterium]|nr:hypothetical protein [Bacteroidia bacterium]